MTIWYIQPPQGFSDEQQLSIIGRPSVVLFSSPEGATGGSPPPPGGTMDYENSINMEYEDLTDMDYES